EVGEVVLEERFAGQEGFAGQRSLRDGESKLQHPWMRGVPQSGFARAHHAHEIGKVRAGRSDTGVTSQFRSAAANYGGAVGEKPTAALESGSEAESIAEQGWIAAGEGYLLTLEDKKLVCRNSAGKRLASVPKPVQQSPAAQQLLALRDWLDQHERTCAGAVEA